MIRCMCINGAKKFLKDDHFPAATSITCDDYDIVSGDTLTHFAVKLPENKRSKKIPVMHNYCPFCGKRYAGITDTKTVQPTPKIIAIDFDGTLCVDAYPAIGQAIQPTIDRAKQAKADGAQLILWTCREGDKLDEAVAWCKGHGLEFDAVNDNTEAAKAQWGNNPRKVGYDELWDDRAKDVV